MTTDFPTIPFLAAEFQRGRNLFDIHEPDELLPAAPQPDDNLVFIYLPERAGEMATTADRFPGGEQRTFDGALSTPLFYAYEVRR